MTQTRKKQNRKLIEKVSAYFIIELPDERIAYLTYEYLKIFDLRTFQFDLILKLNSKQFIRKINILPNGDIVCISQEGISTIIN